MKILLYGRPGVGKTTLLRHVAQNLRGRAPGGFLTEEIRERGTRVGFRVETFTGKAGTLSHIRFAAGPRVGKYRVDLQAFERIGVQALEDAIVNADVILLDEIGKMELFSERFRRAVANALDAPKPVVATIMTKPHPFADLIKARSDVELIEVSTANRDALAKSIADRLSA